MAILRHVFLGCAVLLMVGAAPNENAKVESVASVEEETIDENPVESLNDETLAEVTSGQRQKRWYNYPNFGVPPLYSAPSPFFDEEQEEPFRQIYRKIKDISALVRQPSQQTWRQPSQYYLPVIFIPHLGGCRCPQNDNRRPSGQEPASPAQPSNRPTNPPPAINQNMTVDTRFPEMEDTRQNWGAVSDEDEPEEMEFNRELSFDPIPPSVPTSRPPPPVEHGSTQAGLPNTNANTNSNIDRRQPLPAADAARPTFAAPPQAGRWPPSTANPLNPDQVSEPTDCERAIISCCHRRQVTHQCFIDFDCPNLQPYGNDPCTIDVLVNVATKFSRFYGQRTG